MADFPSTAALLENLQDDSKGLDILAYLLELQVENKPETGVNNPQIDNLANRLYSLTFYPKDQTQDLRQRLSDTVTLLQRHEKLRLRGCILSRLIPETLILIRLSLLNCKDEYGPALSTIYASAPSYSALWEDTNSPDAQKNVGPLDVDAETQNAESQVETRLNAFLVEGRASIFQATKDRLLFLEDILLESNDSLRPLLQDQKSLTTLLMRMCVSATYIYEQSIILLSVRLLRRINSIHNDFLNRNLLDSQSPLDAEIFKHLEVLLRSGHKIQVNAGYHLWVGLLDSHNELFDLNSIIQSESYWDYILNGLDETSGEIKKICLHILWSTLQQLPGDLNLRNFKWDFKNRTSQLEFWKTYITFTEMLALDNSVNQLRLASSELERLIQQANTMSIPNIWILILLSQGFQNSSAGDMSLRLSEFVLRLNTEALWWTKSENAASDRSPLDFFRKTLFPQVFKTPNFNVSVLAQNICGHGNAITSFVQKILTISQDNDENFQDLIGSLLETVFDQLGQANAGQFYALKGIFDTTRSQNACLSLRHGTLLAKIANIPLDNILRGDMKSLICLLLSLKLGLKSEIVSSYVQLSLISQILRNHPKLLDESRARHIIGTLNLDAAQLTAIIDRLSLDTMDDTDVGLYSLVVAIGLRLSNPVSLLRIPRTEAEVSRDGLVVNCVLLRLLEYAHGILEALRNIPEVRKFVTSIFQDIFDNGAHSSHHPDVSLLIPFLEPRERASIQQSAMAVLQDISENWTAGFSDIGDLLTTLRLYLRLCIGCMRSNECEEIPASVINAAVARTASFCEDVYEKVKKKKELHEVLGCFLELIEIVVKTRNKMPADLGYYILITLHINVLPYVDGTGFSIILDCIEHILVACPEALQMVDDLNELLQQWAIKADEDRLGRDQKSNQVKAIAIILHPAILDASVATGPTLIKICKDTQKHMAKRRGLAPALAKALCNAFDVTSATFCREHGFTEVLHEFLVPSVSKKDDNNFDVEEALSVIFDDISGATGSYEKYHGEKEKIAQARIFDLLARFDYDDAIEELWAKTLLDEIFEPWTEIDPKDPMSLRIVQKWKKTQQLQAVLLLERFITEDDADDHLEAIFVALSREANPRYKFLLEWMAFKCILRFPNLRSVVWERFETTEDDIPSYKVSLLRLAYLISVHIQDAEQEQFFTDLVTRAIPCATSNKVTIRHEGAELIPKLYEEATKLEYTTLIENPMFKSIYDYIMDTPYRKVMVPSPTDSFDPVQDFSLVGVLAGSYICCDGGGDIIPLFFAEDFASFDADTKTHYLPIGTNPPPFSEPTSSTNPKETADKPQSSTTGPIQTKGGDWDIKSLLSRQDAFQSRHSTRRQAHQIDVVASLVDNHYNLGGICRVCELSGVQKMYMGNKATALKAKEFTSVSVSSEHWLPIEEVKKQEVRELLAKRRQDGYTIVGIEQTDRSIILGTKDFVFPLKTVLVIGAEKTGIPPELLVEMDICVEVKQFGETRSMNVQTATAVVLYEYVRQNGGIQ
ncbi:hypothetical protein EYR41_009454 [Orbilia oligospora]|uniref:tRNA/rRNA methyltransferase SpoU type domain-containing protein n=1 Tax=Orbilia oligospora TaxID=2813651 RepID=A0A8H2HNH9_ORBOL|nr:hypothetical protein EYR41_009454 [Orbilia oligospora]